MLIRMHPQYDNLITNWRKWRLAFAGGASFVHNYLVQHSPREDAQDFLIRRSQTYSPSFAKAAIKEIIHSIAQRLPDVIRRGGCDSYQTACAGLRGGVDFNGSTMSGFIGKKVLAELLTMGRCGVFIDMPKDVGNTLAEASNKRPYLYVYEIADICNWSIDPYTQDYINVMLKDRENVLGDDGLPTGALKESYRWIRITPEGMVVEFVDDQGKPTRDSFIINGVKRIPFVVFNIEDSLLADVADYQIALLNIASGDVSYCTRANYPIYTEQHDVRLESPHLRGSQPQKGAYAQKLEADAAALAGKPVPPVQGQTSANTGNEKEISAGVGKGRLYPVGTERPGFVSPSPEPLLASIEKQEQMKREIRQLVHLAVAQLAQASAESKQQDATGLEAGLAAIAAELERGERQISEFWESYEGSEDYAEIQYPEDYECKSFDDRISEANELIAVIDRVPSQTYQREVGKRIARTLLSASVSREVIRKIEDELDASKGVTSKIADLALAVEGGWLSTKTANMLIGAPDGDIETANKEHTAKLERIQAAQPKLPQLGAPNAGSLPNDLAPGVDKDAKKGQDKRGAGKNPDKNTGGN